VVPIHGVDIDEQRSPHEASLDRRAVSWTKGCYLGQEAVCMQDMRGKVKRRLVSVLVSSPEVPAAGTPVTTPDGSKVGETRSAASSGVWGGPVAIALLSAEAAVVGTTLRVGASAATVVEPR
jgi:folate-binding protein YgfZ